MNKLTKLIATASILTAGCTITNQNTKIYECPGIRYLERKDQNNSRDLCMITSGDQILLDYNCDDKVDIKKQKGYKTVSRNRINEKEFSDNIDLIFNKLKLQAKK